MIRWKKGMIGTRVAGAARLGATAYSVAPSFWQQYRRELRRPVLPPPHAPNPWKWPDKGIQAAWLGHSTVLLRIDGFTIITDPVFSERAGLHLGVVTLGIKRLVAPALQPHELPRVDLILLSHAHMDHFDIPSLRLLEHHKTSVVTAWQTADLLRTHRYHTVTEVGWGEQARVGPAVIRGLEVNHWGARVRTDRWRGYNGYLIEVGKHRVVFGGDTALTDCFRHLPGRPQVSLALMPIGAYDPWIRRHCSPEEAFHMANEARADRILPIHHQTFLLSREPYYEPIERLHQAAGSKQERIVLDYIGQETSL
jgi:L-ascorbate metabolism protein UlaG (beta-lactamase superfamily)